MNPVEVSIYEFLNERFAVAPDGDVLKTLELHDTVYRKIKSDDGVRIGDADSTISPGQTGLKEYDAELVLVIYSRVIGTDKTQRQAALTKVYQSSLAVAALFYADDSLGGRVCDSLLLRGLRGYDVFDSEPFAVVNLPIVCNVSGAVDYSKRR